MKIAVLFTTLTATLSCVAHAALPSTPPAQAGFDSSRLAVAHATLQRFVDEGRHAGLITLLARDGRIADVFTCGLRDVEKNLPMERDTICRIYSMSKIVTSAAILCLMEDGRLSLDDPIARYLPELKGVQVMTGGTADAPELCAPEKPITIKHLLTHTSGFIYDFDGDDSIHQIYKRADLWSGPGLQDFLTKAAGCPLKHQPGTQFTYGINCDLLGVLIERLTRQRFGDFLHDRLFKPLDMMDTGFDVAPAKMPRLAKTYQHKAGGGFEEAPPLLGTYAEAGHGIEAGGSGLFSTADDFGRFAAMLCAGGTLDGTRILGRKSVELMTTNHLSGLPGGAHGFDPAKGYGLGVEISIDPGRGGALTTPGQFGWYGAATTYCQMDPREKLTAIGLVQHFPYNEHNFFATFADAYYQALK